MRRFILMLAKLALLPLAMSGCASMPNVRSSYYFPKASTNITITQTFSCPMKTTQSQDLNNLSVSAAITLTTTYSADYKRQQGQIDYRSMAGVFSDADLALTFTADGRLSGINATGAGEAGKVLQDVVSIAALAAGVVADAVQSSGGVAGGGKTPCQVVRENFNGDYTKTPPSIALTYSLDLAYDQQLQAGEKVPSAMDALFIEPDPDKALKPLPPLDPTKPLSIPLQTSSQAMMAALTAAFSPNSSIFKFSVKLDSGAPLPNAADWIAPGGPSVALNTLNLAALTVSGPVQTATGASPKISTSALFHGEVPVPTGGQYSIPIAHDLAFGKTNFVLALTDPGGISKLEYGTTSGAPDTADLALAIAKASQGNSTATQATLVQSKADLIYQQQRLLTCEQTPTSCVSK